VDVLLWAVKPQIFPKVVEALAAESVGANNPLHISVIAGMTLETFTGRIAGIYGMRTSDVATRTIRTLPNIGHRVGAGSTGMIFLFGVELGIVL